MFRLTLREHMLVALVTALTIGWCVDHQRHASAAEDARFLAEVAEHGCNCWTAPHFIDLRDKYGVKSKWDFGQVAEWDALADQRRERNQ